MPKLILRRLPLPSTPAKGLIEPIIRATTLACIAHHGQTRKEGQTPQVPHALAVQRLLVQVNVEDTHILAASAVDDALENNPGKRGQWIRVQIENTLGGQVLDLVDALAEIGPSDLPRAKRKALQMERMANAPCEIQVIKLADMVASMQEGPAPNWSVQYAAECDQQRSELVFHVLCSSSEALVQAYSEALLQPAWQSAIAMQSQDGTGALL